MPDNKMTVADDGAIEACSCGLWVCIICRPPDQPGSPFIDGAFTRRIRRELIAEKLKGKANG